MKKIKLLLFLAVLFTTSLNKITAQVSSYTFAESAGTYAALGGTNSTATGDDGIQNGIPIGFNFVMGGTTFTHFCINTNGWIKLGNAATTIGLSGWTNALGNAATHRPLIAALWDDNHRNTGAITYSTTGTAPNQVLTVDWNNVNIGGDGSTSAINLASFQLKVYQTTNVVEIIYSGTLALAGTLSASIGLNDNTSFLSVTPGAPGTASGGTANNGISATTNMVGKKYTFTPASCLAPTGLAASAITTTGATLNWTAVGGATGYEWAVTTSATPPASGTATAATTASATGLTPGTIYYLHVRTVCGATFSNWATISFTTLCTIGTIPYTENFDASAAPPLCFNFQDLNANTTWSIFTAGGNGTATPPNSIRYNWNTPTGADDWFFLRGLNLTSGTSYRLRFKYKASNGPTFIEKLEVKYGAAPNAAAMTTGTLFTNTNINNAVADPFIQASVDFTPTATGDYFIGFHCFSDPDQAFLYIDDIEVIVTPTCNEPTGLATSAITANTATVSWTAVAGAVGYQYEVTTSATPSGTWPNTTAATTVNLSGLTGTTLYYFHIRTNCGATQSIVSSISFTTTLDCNAATVITACNTAQTATIAAGTGSYSNNACGFTTPGRELLYSFTPTITGIYTLNITAAPGTGYIDYMYKDATGGCDATGWTCIDDNNAVGTDVFGPLTAGTTYFILLDAETTAGVTQTFELLCPVSPPATCATNTAPAGGATGVTPNPGITFTWAAVPGATSYTFFLSTTNNPPNRATDSILTVNTNTVTLVGAFAGNTTYCWYVIPKNSGGEGPNCTTAAQTTCFTTAAGPANDACSNATSLTVSNGFCSAPVLGTLNLADSTNGLGDASCVINLKYDVWYSVIIPGSGNVVVQTSAVNTAISDLVLEAYSGACGTLTSIACDDDGNPESFPSSAHSRIALTGRAPGEVVYFRVMPFSNTNIGAFSICAFDTTNTVLPAIASGANCIDGSVNIDSARKYMWTPLSDGGGNIIGEIYPNGNLLGNTTYSYYINAGPVRKDAANIYYLDRNVTITPTTQPTSTVNVRLYYKSSELDALQVVAPAVTSTNISATKTGNTCANSASTIELGTYIAQSANGRYSAVDSFATINTSSFSTFFLHGGLLALPVQFTSIRGEVTGNSNTVYWVTAQENNNRKFVVERSVDGRSFNAIGEVGTQALNGNSSIPLLYSFADNAPVTGKSFYRLRMVDNGGRESISATVTLLRGKGKFEIVDVRPNPTTGLVYFNLLGNSTGATVVVRSINGSEVMRKSMLQTSGSSIDMSRFAPGMYLLEATDRNGEKATFKIVKQ
jgi:hypothetical protein